jgi:membrane protease YdiL (CAAX protease family)
MQTKAQVDLKPVWTMLIVPPLLLGALIFGYVLLAGGGSAGDNIEPMVRGALPYLIAVNHTLVLGLLMYLLRKRGQRLTDIGWRAPSGAFIGREIGIGLMVGVELYLFKEFGVDSVRALMAGQTPTFYSLFNFSLERSEVPLLVVATTLVFIEESVYRGFAIPPLRRRFGLGAALAISSICFGFLHWGNGMFAIGATSVIGFFFALVFIWRRNLIVGTVAHALYNLLVIMT